MSNASSQSSQDSKPEYSAPYFHGALTTDCWANSDDPAFFRVSADSVADIGRAASAIASISRIVRNSLGEPACTGAEPLGHSAHIALLDGLEIIGRYIDELGLRMRETASMHAHIDSEEGDGSDGHV
jgi:hypothetical protein